MHKYDAFISYSRKDKQFAELLETKLEKYKPPKSIRTPVKHLNVFRDEGDLSGTDYNAAIEQHLETSAKLIVICSPNSAKSKFVNDEIKSFLKFNKPENIITVLLRGLPNNEVTEETKHLSAFPDIIGDVQSMPLAKDYRNFDFKEQKVNKGVYQHNWFKLLADILDKSIDEVTEKETKRKIKNRNQVIAFASVIIIALSILSAIAFIQKGRADENAGKEKEQRELAEYNDSIAQVRKGEAEYEAQRALDSAKVAKEQRELAQLEAKRANDSAISAQIQRTKAVMEAQRANDSANVAQEQRGIAQEQTKEAIKQTGIAIENEAETNRINELLLAENLSFQSLSLTNPESKKSTALEAYGKYLDCSYNTSVDASREKPIYEALYKLNRNTPVSTDMECKYLFIENNKLLGFGTNIEDDNTPSYFSLDPKSPIVQSLRKFSEASSPVNYYTYLPDLKTLITFHEDHSLVFWKLNNNQLERQKSFQLGDQELIREVAYSKEQDIIAAAGISPNIHLFDLVNDSYKTISTESRKIVGITYKQKNIFVFDNDGYVQKIEGLRHISDRIKISDATVITSTSNEDKTFLGLVDGKILVLDNDKLNEKGFVPFAGNSRVELLYIDPTGTYLISSYADKTVHMYNLKYINDPYYKPRVINDLAGKVRSMVVDDNYVFMSLSDKTLVKYDLNMDRLAATLGYTNYNMTKK